jgi:hypothetical protein
MISIACWRRYFFYKTSGSLRALLATMKVDEDSPSLLRTAPLHPISDPLSLAGRLACVY